MRDDRIAVVDVETTGLFPWRNDRIVEIAIVVVSANGNILTEYETLVNPKRDIGPSSIHRITSADVLRAPVFADLAGDILEILSGTTVIAGHNVSFDKNFLIKEYERLGIPFPDMNFLCTCRLFGRAALLNCCQELGIVIDGTPHRAITDARATAKIVAHFCSEDPSLLDDVRMAGIAWPFTPPLRTPCIHREHARRAQEEPPSFLKRIAERIHHDVEAETPDVLAYMALIDRVLEDRAIDSSEEEILVEAASGWKLSATQLADAHQRYLHSLAVTALADGHISDSEMRDLQAVARLLGEDPLKLDDLLRTASTRLASMSSQSRSNLSESDLKGKRVCFTGELQSSIDGQPISRELAETLATQAGLIVVSNVTKKLDLLVVADPNTQSGKAMKARSYGVRILSDLVFWRQAGIVVD